MKKLIVSMFALASILASCSSDDDLGVSIETPEVTPGETSTVIGGRITEDLTLVANTEYQLTEALFVEDGTTLTIEEGVTIQATAGGTDIFILVDRGGVIEANGTANAPIIITSSATTPSPGDWGGLIINGRAPISRQEGGSIEAATEVRNDILFGGDIATDDSGTLNYVTLEYTGARINDDAEHNGLTLNGVGNGTTISNIAIFNGDDDAIEWFGGTVDVTNLLVVNPRDDMFDVSQGWTGTLTNAYGIREAGFASVTSDPRGVESDGNLDGNTPTDINQSNFTMTGITIVNEGSVELNDAIKVRRGATSTITNALIIDVNNSTVEGSAIGFSDFVDFEDSRGNANTNATVSVNGIGISETDIKFGDSDATNVTVPSIQNTGADTTVFAWTGFQF